MDHLLSNSAILKNRKYDFFEELSVYKKAMFRIQHVAITIPTTVRLLVKFADEIPKIIAWRNAVVKHVEQF